MMLLIRTLSIFILSTQLAFADLCHFVFKKVPTKQIAPDIRLIGKLNRIESLTKITRKLRTKGGKENVMMMEKIRSEFKVIKAQIFEGEVEIAIRNYRVLFRNAEKYALLTQNYERIIKTLNKGIRVNARDYERFLKDEGLPKYLILEHIEQINKLGASAYLKTLNSKLRKAHRKLGNSFDKYFFIRNEIDTLASSARCKELCQGGLKKFYSEVGIFSQAERHLHQNIIKYKRGIKLSTVQKIFNSHPEAVIIARRKEFIAEAIGLIRKKLNNTNIMRRLIDSLANTSAVKNSRLVKLFKRTFDRRAHSVHKEMIETVSNTPGSAKEKLALFFKETKGLNTFDAMADFSRYPDYAAKKTWSELKDQAVKSNDDILYREMLDAEAWGKRIGKVSKKMPKDLNGLISTLVVGGAFVSYFAFSTQEEQVNGEDDSIIPLSPDANDDSVIILDDDDIGNIQDNDDIIILKYNSKLDQKLREELLDIVDTINQNTEKLSTDNPDL